MARFKPCIDLHAGVVKQIVGSTLTTANSGGNDAGDAGDGALRTNFTAKTPSEGFATMYRDADLRGGHVIMLGPGNEAAALRAVRAYPGGLQVGGGITPANARTYLDAGASHVIVTSYVFRAGKVDYARLRELVAAVGKQRLVLDLSCRRRATAGGGGAGGGGAGGGGADGSSSGFFVVTDKWQKYTDVEVTAATLTELAAYCDEFLVHGVDVEGKRCGIEEDLVRFLGRHCPAGVPCTYAGGVRSIADMDKVHALGNGRVDITVGSALDIFGGAVAFADVVEWDRRQRGGTPAGGGAGAGAGAGAGNGNGHGNGAAAGLRPSGLTQMINEAVGAGHGRQHSLASAGGGGGDDDGDDAAAALREAAAAAAGAPAPDAAPARTLSRWTSVTMDGDLDADTAAEAATIASVTLAGGGGDGGGEAAAKRRKLK